MTLVPASALPGSAAAVALGCACDPIKNADGDGWTETVPHTQRSREFWAVAADCPVHGPLPEKKGKTK